LKNQFKKQKGGECLHSLDSFEGYDTWDHIRYLLEKKHGLIQFPHGRGGTVIVGWKIPEGARSYDDLLQIKDTELLLPGDKILLKRETLLPHELHYMPLKFQRNEFEEYCRGFPKNCTPPPHPIFKQQRRDLLFSKKLSIEEENAPACAKLWEDMTEEEKMVILMEKGDSQICETGIFEKKEKQEEEKEDSKWPLFFPAGATLHALSQREIRKLAAPPPTTYLCHRCRKRGHWKQDCPTWADLGHKNMGDFPTAHGIPAYMLRKIDLATATDEELSRAKKSQQGELFLLISEEEQSKSSKKPLTCPSSFSQQQKGPQIRFGNTSSSSSSSSLPLMNSSTTTTPFFTLEDCRQVFGEKDYQQIFHSLVTQTPFRMESSLSSKQRERNDSRRNELSSRDLQRRVHSVDLGSQRQESKDKNSKRRRSRSPSVHRSSSRRRRESPSHERSMRRRR
jgi:hypothetical protein